MTDITDQDTARLALAWAEDRAGKKLAPETGQRERDAAVRFILATVDAPEPTLAEELRGWESIFRNEGRSVDANSMRTLAARVEQIEQERDYWKGYALDRQREVERLTAERVTDPSPTINDPSMTRPATVAREENVYPDLPDPADVKPGEAWLVQVDGKAVAALRIGNGRWVTASGTGFYVWTHGVERLVSSLLPEVTA